MACLMHHKFILIDAEPQKSKSEKRGENESETFSSSDDDDDDEEVKPLCAKCSDPSGDRMASDGAVSVSTECVQCRPVRIRSKKDLVQFPSDFLPRLPKNGLLITGSHNWSTQVGRISRRKSSDDVEV